MFPEKALCPIDNHTGNIIPDLTNYAVSKKLPWPFYTPTKQFTNFTALEELPKVELDCSYEYSKDNEFGHIPLTVKNTSDANAFFNFFDVQDPLTNKPVLPIYRDDNYVSLLPGESHTYTAKFFLEDFKGEKPVVAVKEWNVESVILN